VVYPIHRRRKTAYFKYVNTPELPDLLCFCHLRWDFVFQRPQHLMTRFADERRVFVIEEPIFGDDKPSLAARQADDGVCVLTPHLPPSSRNTQHETPAIARLLDSYLAANRIQRYVSWYYSAMFLPQSRHLTPEAIVYDCMDELSAFKNADPRLTELESELLRSADLVFTGGASLFRAKKSRHPHTYLFPSSVDSMHFAKARNAQPAPADAPPAKRPVIGFSGVIDERMNLDMVDGIAAARPDWTVQLIGPVVKIDTESLPRRPNIQYLGQKPYALLPEYIAHWDVAILPFAHNDSTRFISPTKTPEYLAAGRPVVSTSIHDVVSTYAKHDVIHFADDVDGFVAAIERALAEDSDARNEKVDRLLSQSSWASTWRRMSELISDVLERKHPGPSRPVRPMLLAKPASASGTL
jgi:UDP-galactopyranose mutase